MTFKDIWALLLLLGIFPLLYAVKRFTQQASVRFSSKELLKGYRPNLKASLSRNIIYLRIFAIILFLFAFARPRIPLEETKIETEGIDIVLAIDSSGSMLAEDFTMNGRRQNRLEVVKEVVEDFIQGRKNDRIGIITFAAQAYTVCPLTLDYDWLVKNLERIEIGAIEDGTAIGSGISSALNRLKETDAKSKIIILLTDGVNNTGKISPLTAAEAAEALKVKVYTIGAGSKGLVPYPVKGFFGQTVYQNVKIDIDEEGLKQIAEKTGGVYFRATDTTSLKKIYEEIDAMEKTPIEDTGYLQYRELFSLFLLPGLFLLVLEIVLSNTVLRRLP